MSDAAEIPRRPAPDPPSRSGADRLLQIARAHLGDLGKEIRREDIEYFVKRLRESPNQHSTDQLLNALLLRRTLGLDDSASAERTMHKLQDAPGD